MLYSLCRLLSPRRPCKIKSINVIAATRTYKHNVFFTKETYSDQQTDYLRSILENNSHNWTTVKNDILAKRGNLNEKNIDSVMLKMMVGSKNLSSAISFAEYLKKRTDVLPLGTINGLLNLYTKMSETEKLSKEDKQFILDTYKHLYDKYKLLEFSTCERLLHALCVIDEWEKAQRVLNDIHLSSVPSHSAYSTLIATFFRLNKKKKAIEIINESIKYKRPLQDNAYEEWINYVLRKYKDKKTILKYMEEIFNYISKNYAIISVNTANKLKEVYKSLEWDADFARIRKQDGQCFCCKDRLNLLKLTDEEFKLLQENVKEKLIVGSDLFLKTSPEELQRFSEFVEENAPYDIVLDGLNISYAVGKGHNMEKLRLLNKVVDYFVEQNKKVLLLGRKHMMNWNRQAMHRIMSKTCAFLAQDISQDDPYFITAAILSGPHTDIMSKDLLRGHNFKLKDENLKFFFRRWQWQHQWMMFMNVNKGLIIQPPLKFTPCAQNKNKTWHIPYESEDTSAAPQVNDGTPDLKSWLCLRQEI